MPGLWALVALALRRFYALTALVVLGGGLVFLSLLQPIVGTRTDFSIYNTRWNGASGVAADLYETGGLIPAFDVSFGNEVVEVSHRSFADFELEAATSALVVIGPDQDVTAAERRWLSSFVRDGGLLVVADDFGTGNQFLEAAGAGTRFVTTPMRDLAFTKNPDFVVVASFVPSPLTAGVDEAVLDYPGSLVAGPGAAVLSQTSASSWQDVFRDGRLRGSEQVGPFPWLVVETVGAGTLIIMSDPSIMINGMRDLADNGVLLANLEAILTARPGGVLIDESHRAYADPVHLSGARLEELGAVGRAGLGIAGFLLFLAATTRDPLRFARRPAAAARRVAARLAGAPEAPAPRDLPAQAKARHPEWDENTLRELMQRGATRDE